jgi:thiamine pyrophosphokinase
MPATVVVLSASPDTPLVQALPPDAFVIAADGGGVHARRLGLHVHLLVGDLDSVSESALVASDRVARHPVDKDATDLELALAEAARLEPERILVLGGSSGRLDHLFGSLLLLAAEKYARVTIDAQFGEAAVHVVRGERLLHGRTGDLISLFAVHGPADGVSTEGLVYPLAGETLEPGSSRGISNRFAGTGTQARISVARGVLLAVRPNGIGPAEMPG